MTFSSSHKDLFHEATAGDRLTSFQSLMEWRTLDAEQALPLLKVIHDELGSRQNQDRSAYRQYVQAMQVLRHQWADVYQQVTVRLSDARNASRTGPTEAVDLNEGLSLHPMKEQVRHRRVIIPRGDLR